MTTTSRDIRLARSQAYRIARDAGTLQAAMRGPGPLSKRFVRIQVYKRSNRMLGHTLKALGL